MYDTTAGIPAVIKELHDGTPVYYIREPNGALIARVVGSSLDATTTRHYHFDALGSTRKLTDKDGVVTDTYSYDAWGNTTHTGSTEQPYQYVGQLGYYTHWQDENLELRQLGVRFYDPETGRFTQQDPAGEGTNWYLYTANLPTARTDASGLTWGDNWDLFWDWWLERGAGRRDYGPTDPSTLEIMNSAGVRKARAAAAAACGGTDVEYETTLEGMWDTVTQPWNGTMFQVGGYQIRWTFNCNGTVTYRIYNRLGLDSFFYHLYRRFGWGIVRDRWRRQPGPGGNMHQYFTWTEAAPASCGCVSPCGGGGGDD